MLRDDDNKYCVDCDAKGKYAYKHTNMHLKWIFVHTHKHARICTAIVFVVGGGASDPLSFKAPAWINLGLKKGSTHIKLAYIKLGRQYIYIIQKKGISKCFLLAACTTPFSLTKLRLSIASFSVLFLSIVSSYHLRALGCHA